MADPDTTLSFSTLHEGLPITIDGQPYQIRHPDSLTLGALKDLELLAPRLGVLLQRPNLTPQEEKQLSTGLAKVCQLALDAPAEVQARLTDAQRLKVVEAFTQLRPATRPLTGATTAMRPAPGGRKSSRGSSASTGDRRPSGTGARRSG